MLTGQEIFNKSVSGLLNQGKQSNDEFGDSCMYRGNEEGSKCAIGHLIDDNLYTPKIEGHTFRCLVGTEPVLLTSCGIDVEYDNVFELCIMLQIIHDEYNSTDSPFNQYIIRQCTALADTKGFDKTVLQNWEAN